MAGLYSVVGLDVSTSCIGVAFVQDKSGVICREYIGHIDPTVHGKSLFLRADAFSEQFDLFLASRVEPQIHDVYIEDAAKKFSQGMSSADTISTLMRFNGIVSYIVYKTLGIEPKYISPGEARKLCGLKTRRVSVAGKSHKEQAFEFFANGELSDVVWPKKKRSEKVVDWSRDATDAYCIARAAIKRNELSF